MFENFEIRVFKKDLIGQLSDPCKKSEAWDGSEIYESGEPPEVIVRFTQTEIQVYRCSFFWDGPHNLVKDPQLLGTVNWKLLGCPDARFSCLILIKNAQEQRRNTFRKCRYCGGTFPPEHMADDVCYSCEEIHLHVIH